MNPLDRTEMDTLMYLERADERVDEIADELERAYGVINTLERELRYAEGTIDRMEYEDNAQYDSVCDEADGWRSMYYETLDAYRELEDSHELWVTQVSDHVTPIEDKLTERELATPMGNRW